MRSWGLGVLGSWGLKVLTNTDLVLVLTTFPADGDSEALARTLVSDRLAACVNILPPMRSIYRWKGAVEDASERQLVIKTTAARVPELQLRLKTLHPYEVPEFLVLPITEGSPDYLSWLTDSTR
jgi:periplasmic divalent cation tolerance protein